MALGKSLASIFSSAPRGKLNQDSCPKGLTWAEWGWWSCREQPPEGGSFSLAPSSGSLVLSWPGDRHRLAEALKLIKMLRARFMKSTTT